MTGTTSLSVGQAVQQATSLLATAGLDSPRHEALALAQYALDLSRAQVYVRWNQELNDEALGRFNAAVQRRAQREPFAYISGQQPFYDIELLVDPRVLIPRPETELLVERALAWGAAQHRPELRIVDVGTGSGAIAIALARGLPGAQVLAVDLSDGALQVARENARLYGLEGRITFSQSDLLSGIPVAPARPLFDLVAANLPYIPQERMAVLQPEVSDYEPHLALDGGDGGLDLVLRLVQQLGGRLARPGLCLLEIDDGQGARVRQAVEAALVGARVEVVNDHAGLERLVCIER